MRAVPKNKTGGVVTNTVMGVGGLIIGVIVVYVLVSTVIDADLFSTSRTSNSTTNETLLAVNETGSNFVSNNLPSYLDTTCSITQVRNSTGIIISSNLYTQTGCSIAYSHTNKTYNNSLWQVDYSTAIDGDAEISVDDMNANLTVGIGNVSSKIPTILLIVAVVFLFGALILLMRNAKLMGVGDSSSL